MYQRKAIGRQIIDYEEIEFCYHNDVNNMKIEERVKGNVCVISIIGRMDAVSSKEVEDKLDHIIRSNNDIILNLAKMDYISSVGIRTLLSAYKKQKLKKRQFGLIYLHPFAENVFRITGLDKVFPIYQTEEAAIRGFTYNQDLKEGKTSADSKDRP
jgi:anti-sigma B factor antagonist